MVDWLPILTRYIFFSRSPSSKNSACITSWEVLSGVHEWGQSAWKYLSWFVGQYTLPWVITFGPMGLGVTSGIWTIVRPCQDASFFKGVFLWADLMYVYYLKAIVHNFKIITFYGLRMISHHLKIINYINSSHNKIVR